MLNPAEINPLALPSVALEDRRQLPAEPCIYFAIDGQGVVQYVGQSQNPRRRWQGHTQLKHLSKMTGVLVAYMPVRPSLLTGFEEILISKYRPALNCLDVRPLIKLGMNDYWEKLKNVIAPNHLAPIGSRRKLNDPAFHPFPDLRCSRGIPKLARD